MRTKFINVKLFKYQPLELTGRMTGKVLMENLSFDLLNSLQFCVFDLETTGGNHKNDKIIEIGLVKIQNLEIIEKKTYLINPELKIPDFIQKLTNISQDDVKDAPTIEEVIEDITNFMSDSILVAHNTSFDVPFFNSVLRRLGKKELDNKSICTNLMTKYLIPNLMNSNLNYMSKIFGIEHSQAHRALDDALATAKLLQKYLKIFIDKKISKINHLYYPRNRYELDRCNFKVSNSNAKEILDVFKKLKTPSLVTIKGENGIILFALPCLNTPQELNLIKEKLSENNWETVTIKLTGPFIEALVHFNLLFNKLSSDARNEIINFLWDNHLPNGNRNVPEEEEKTELIKGAPKQCDDFIITNHIVPDQYIIYPIQSLHHKSELVFRYPGHRKKLIQYINSKSSRIKNSKLKKIHIQQNLKHFILSYISECKSNEKDLFVFPKELPQKQQEDFFDNLEKFLVKQPNTYHYPKEYI